MSIDLTFGHPEFMKPFWDNIALPATSYTPDYTRYPVPNEADSASVLNTDICQLHRLAKNLPEKVLSEYHIVAANGGMQLINAIFLAYKKLYGRDKVYIPSTLPQWTYFKYIAHQCGLKYGTDEITAHCPALECFNPIHFIASPNNPMNVLDEIRKVDVLDGCYRWPMYMGSEKDIPYKEADVYLFSLSKATGFAGLRFGWAFVKDSGTAMAIAEAIEFQTAGVSKASILEVSKVLGKLTEGSGKCFYEMTEYGNNLLKQRHKAIDALTDVKVNTSGVFGLLKRDTQIDGVQGLQMTNSPMIRYNLGCSEEKFQKFTDILADIYGK